MTDTTTSAQAGRLDIVAAAIRAADAGIERGTRPLAQAIAAAVAGIGVQWHPAALNEVIGGVDGWDEIGAAELAHHVLADMHERAQSATD